MLKTTTLYSSVTYAYKSARHIPRTIRYSWMCALIVALSGCQYMDFSDIPSPHQATIPASASTTNDTTQPTVEDSPAKPVAFSTPQQENAAQNAFFARHGNIAPNMPETLLTKEATSSPKNIINTTRSAPSEAESSPLANVQRTQDIMPDIIVTDKSDKVEVIPLTEEGNSPSVLLTQTPDEKGSTPDSTQAALLTTTESAVAALPTETSVATTPQVASPETPLTATEAATPIIGSNETTPSDPKAEPVLADTAQPISAPNAVKESNDSSTATAKNDTTPSAATETNTPATTQAEEINKPAPPVPAVAVKTTKNNKKQNTEEGHTFQLNASFEEIATVDILNELCPPLLDQKALVKFRTGLERLFKDIITDAKSPLLTVRSLHLDANYMETYAQAKEDAKRFTVEQNRELCLDIIFYPNEYPKDLENRNVKPQRPRTETP